MQITINKLDSSEVEIIGELPATDFAVYRAPALENLKKEIKIDGFRPGKAPDNVVEAKLGNERLLMEMAELALREIYPQIVREHKIDAIGRPDISITKIAKDNPLGFKIKTAIHPEVTLPDYKKLATSINAEPQEVIKVEEQEVTEVIEQIRRGRAVEEAKKNGMELKPDEKPTLPELNDDFAKSLGHFTDLADLRAKIGENLKLEKEQKNRDKRRIKIIEAVAKEAKMILPEILIETELDKMTAEMREQIERMGLKFEDYLKHLKKEIKDLRQDWRADADKRVRAALVIGQIAMVEKIGAPEDILEKEVKHLKQHYPDADESRLRAHVGNLLVNEATLKFLETQK